jgi:DNA-binding GntR family transcriptional regulator
VVTHNLVRSAQDRVIAMKTTGKIYPSNEHAQITHAELLQAPPQVANALGLELGTPAICRVRVTYRDNEPVSASTSWFDGALAEVAPNLLVAERLTQGTAGYIADRTGRIVDVCQDQLWADVAGDQDAAALGVPVGSAIQRKRNWFFDTDGVVVEYGESAAAAGRMTTYKYKTTN